jgi:CheY-like chemotaxis protein
MNLAECIRPHLVFARRFARALSGSQESGDAYVAATLEAIIADPALLRPERARVDLFRLLLKLWDGLLANREGGDSRSDPTRKLQDITPRPRQAFLLVNVEGFTRSEAAEILEATVEEVDGLLDAASREMAAGIATSVLIIEDEPLIAIDIESIVSQLGHDVIGVARTREEAIRAVQKRKPGLILADIHLADGSSGIDAINEIVKQCEVPAIFVTAYPERLLSGVRAEPTFLVTKPFMPESLRGIISQALFFDQAAVHVPA